MTRMTAKPAMSRLDDAPLVVPLRPLVSVVIPCLNEERYIVPLLDSLAGIGFSLNHFPFAKLKKSFAGFTVVSICSVSGSLADDEFLFDCCEELEQEINNEEIIKREK